MSKQLRKAFFDHFQERLRILENIDQEPFVNVDTSEKTWDFLEHVGTFLLAQGVISEHDLKKATSMAEDYGARLFKRFGR